MLKIKKHGAKSGLNERTEKSQIMFYILWEKKNPQQTNIKICIRSSSIYRVRYERHTIRQAPIFKNEGFQVNMNQEAMPFGAKKSTSRNFNPFKMFARKNRSDENADWHVDIFSENPRK